MSEVLTFKRLSYIFPIDETPKQCCITNCKNIVKLGTPFCWFCVNQCCAKNCSDEAMLGSIFCATCLIKEKII